LHFQEVKIRDYNDKAIDKLGQKLYEFNTLCGIREPLEVGTAIFILRMLQEKFKDFSYQEISEAFYDYLSGNTVKIENYGTFTPVFVSSVLNAYKTKRNKELALYHRELAKITITKEPTEAEKKEIEREFLKNVLFVPYKKAVESGSTMIMDDINASMLFKKFFRAGIIKVTSGQAERYRQKAIEELKKPKKALLNKHDVNALNELIDRFKLVEVDPMQDKEAVQMIKDKSCALFFVDFLNQNVIKKTDLEKLFTDYEPNN